MLDAIIGGQNLTPDVIDWFQNTLGSNPNPAAAGATQQANADTGDAGSGPGKLGLIETDGLQDRQATVAGIYNRHGATIEAMAERAELGVAQVMAVIAQETGGHIDSTERMTIRFEVHKFRDGLDKADLDTFNAHFTYNSDKRWTGHKFNAIGEGKVTADGTPGQWRYVHPTGLAQNDQDINWEAFEFASQINPEAAARAISMGPGQVLGSNHASVGYDSAVDMFDTLSDDTMLQFQAMMNFINSEPPIASALNDGDYDTFATRYNGGGIGNYGSAIGAYVEAFEALAQDAAAQK